MSNNVIKRLILKYIHDLFYIMFLRSLGAIILGFVILQSSLFLLFLVVDLPFHWLVENYKEIIFVLISLIGVIATGFVTYWAAPGKKIRRYTLVFVLMMFMYLYTFVNMSEDVENYQYSIYLIYPFMFLGAYFHDWQMEHPKISSKPSTERSSIRNLLKD
jgi:hypothetical protein